MAVDCYATVRRYPHCARNSIKLRQNVTELKLYPEKAPLGSVAIDVLVELIRTTRGNLYLLVITDRYTTLVETIPINTDSALELARHFVHEWVFN